MRVKIVVALAAILCLLAAGLVWASGTPSIPWWVMGGGGGQVEAGIYSLDATIGQAAVGVNTGGDYELCSGFWCGEAEASPTPTPTSTSTSTATPTATPTGTPPPTATPTATPTGTITPSAHLIYLPIILRNYP